MSAGKSSSVVAKERRRLAAAKRSGDGIAASEECGAREDRDGDGGGGRPLTLLERLKATQKLDSEFFIKRHAHEQVTASLPVLALSIYTPCVIDTRQRI